MSNKSRVEPQYLCSLQSNLENIRNMCILAHVDHGKTTLSDSLVCSNGVISEKLAGKLRFLDSTEEEQKRGITIHSSAISLLYRPDDNRSTAELGVKTLPNSLKGEYLVNLIDCPGHIDFSSDVSTATRLCDGALIIVDVLEGVCTQTRAVLHKALKERMRPCLVLNKIDRLVIELRLSPVEAFALLRRVVENVNALAAQLVNSEMRLLEEEERIRNDTKNTSWRQEDVSCFQEFTSDQWNFSPDNGNMIFASALDCWGFGASKFVNMWANKLGLNRSILNKYIFEDYALQVTTKKIVKVDPQNREMKPMFVTMILDQIWLLYETAILQHNPEKAARIAAKRLNVEITPREINNREPRLTVQAIFRQWLPLSDAILRMVVRCVPSPLEAQRSRISTLMQNNMHQIANKDEIAKITKSTQQSIGLFEWQSRLCQRIDHARKCIINCRKDSAFFPISESIQSFIQNSDISDSALSQKHITNEPPAEVVVFVSKMMPVRVADLSSEDVTMLQNKAKLLIEKACTNFSNKSLAQSPFGTDIDIQGSSSLKSLLNHNILRNPNAGTDGNESVSTGGVKTESILRQRLEEVTSKASNGEITMALARVFAGTLSTDCDLFVLSHRHDPVKDVIVDNGIVDNGISFPDHFYQLH